jgi:tRNA-dihydrouridine synthase
VKDNPRIQIPIFGNGDIDSPEKAMEFQNLYGVDGIMVGRAAIGYPWIFREIKHYVQTGEKMPAPTIDERVDIVMEHLERSIEWKGEVLGILEMRRHYSNYLKGLPHIKEFRNLLVQLNHPEEIRSTLYSIADRYRGMEQEMALVSSEL